MKKLTLVLMASLAALHSYAGGFMAKDAIISKMSASSQNQDAFWVWYTTDYEDNCNGKIKFKATNNKSINTFNRNFDLIQKALSEQLVVDFYSYGDEEKCDTAASLDLHAPFPEFNVPKNQEFPNITAIAHAGGGVFGLTYSNSWQAIEKAVKNNFTLLEIDFSWTTDGKLVCLHDWHTNRYPDVLKEFKKGARSFEEFQKMDDQLDNLDFCNLDSLALWLDKNPKVSIVTDVKQNSSKAIARFADKVINKDQFIIQIYEPKEYEIAKKNGFNNIIWTLYKYSGSANQVVELVDSMDLFAVTMPGYRVEQFIAARLAEKGIPTYVHTINKEIVKNKYQNKYHVTDIYTDFLLP